MANRTVQLIPLAQIDVDRLPINPTVLGLISYISNGGVVPPIKVQHTRNGRFKLKDGRHRFLAYKLMGHQLIEAKFSKMPNMRCWHLNSKGLNL